MPDHTTHGDALDPLGFTWLTSHDFRKTAATLLDDGGLTVRETADQLDTNRVSETLDTISATPIEALLALASAINRLAEAVERYTASQI